MLKTTWTYADSDTVKDVDYYRTELHDLYLSLVPHAEFYGRTIEWNDNGTVNTAHRILIRVDGKLHATITETIEEQD